MAEQALPKRIGRRPGESGSREAILDAASVRFAQHGYEGATIRGIATDAGVDPALVHHFFGTKDKLFVAAMRLPIDPAEVIPKIVAAGPDGAGERLAALFVYTMREQGDANPLLGLLRSATAHGGAARMLREFFTSAVLEKVAAALDVPQPRLRAALCASQMMGLLVAHQVVGLPPLVEADSETLVAAIGPVIQHYMSDPLPGDQT
jgi:AcrR family transcriptional regulator